MKTPRVRNVRACEKLLSAARCVRERTGSSRRYMCTCSVVSTAAAYTAGPVYTCIYLHMSLWPRIHQKYEILLRYTAGIKYTFVLQRARRRVCAAVYTRIVRTYHYTAGIYRVSGISSKTVCIVNHREDYKTVYDLLRRILSPKKVRVSRARNFFPSLNEKAKKNSPPVCCRCRCCLACIIRDLYRMSICILYRTMYVYLRIGRRLPIYLPILCII